MKNLNRTTMFLNMKKVFICLLLIITATKISYAQNFNKILGDNYFNHLAYVKAIKYYEKALLKDSTNLHILKHLAQSYKNSGHFDKAEELYELLRFRKDTTSMEEYTRLLIYNDKYSIADSLMAQFDLSLPTYNRTFIDSLKSIKPQYNISLAGINTKYSDFRPCFYKNYLIFTSARDSSKNEYEWNGQPYLSLFSARLYDNGNLKYAKPFSQIDSRYHISSFQYVEQYSMAYFTMNNNNDANSTNELNEINLGIYTSKFKKGHWQKPEPVKNITSKEYSSAHPYFSVNEDRLYFSSNRPGGYGGSDIYYVEVYTIGTSEPINCGENVNTPGDEVYPFVCQDGTLYFSSNGHPGLGGLDVFSAKIDDNIFSDVQNLGAPINSSRDDFSLIFKEDQSIGYLASNRSGGKGDDDIYLIKKIKSPKKVEEVSALDSIGNIQQETSLLASINNNGVVTGTEIIGTPPDLEIIKTEETTEPELLSNQKLTIETISEIMDKIDISNASPEKDRLKNITFKLYNINFDFDSWEINAEAAKELDKLADLMIKYRRMTIELSSHTDSRGNNAYNKVLSQARADAALKYILIKGISIRRIEAVGYGEQKPLNRCTDGIDCPDELHKENRRVEVLIKNY